MQLDSPLHAYIFIHNDITEQLSAINSSEFKNEGPKPLTVLYLVFSKHSSLFLNIAYW